MDENVIFEQACIRLGLFSVDDGGNVLITASPKDAMILREMVRKAVADCRERRSYPKAYTDEMVSEDLANYSDTALEVVIYDWNKQGAEGESSHNENSTYRSYESRRSIVRQIKPITKVVG